MVAINSIHEPFIPAHNQKAKGSQTSGPSMNGVATVPGVHAAEHNLGYIASPVVDDQTTADKQRAILDSKALSGLQMSFGGFLAVLSRGMNTGAVSPRPDAEEETEEAEEERDPTNNLAVSYPEPPVVEDQAPPSTVPPSQRDISLDILA